MTVTTGISTIEIAADPRLVWDVLTDFARLDELSPEAYKAEWVEGSSAPEPGARFRGFNRNSEGFEWDTSCLVVGATPGIDWSFAVATNEGMPTIWRYLIAETEQGCVVTETFDAPAVVADYFQAMNPPRDEQLRGNISETLKNLKRMIEAT